MVNVLQDSIPKLQRFACPRFCYSQQSCVDDFALVVNVDFFTKLQRFGCARSMLEMGACV